MGNMAASGDSTRMSRVVPVRARNVHFFLLGTAAFHLFSLRGGAPAGRILQSRNVPAGSARMKEIFE
jgi:hypothetical protein